MTREVTLELLKKYFKMTYKPPKRYYQTTRTIFQTWSYEYWATKELYGYLIRTSLPVIDAIELWRKKVDDFGCLSKNERTKLIFSCAYDVATVALDYLISIEEIWGDYKIRKGF